MFFSQISKNPPDSGDDDVDGDGEKIFIGKCYENLVVNSQHIQEVIKFFLGQFPMLNFSRRTPTLGWFFPPDSEKVLKIAHFCVFRHIGGVEWVRKNMDLKIQWVKGNCSKNCGYWASWGPTIIFSEKKSPYLNNLSPIHNHHRTHHPTQRGCLMSLSREPRIVSQIRWGQNDQKKF